MAWTRSLHARIIGILLMLLAFLTVKAFGAEGGAIAGFALRDRGDFVADGYYLCDGNKTATTTCGEFDIAGTARGWPSFYTIKLLTLTGAGPPTCTSALNVTPLGTDTTGGTTENLVGSALTWDGVRGQGFVFPTHRYVSASLTGNTTCTDVEVGIILYFRRR